MSMMELRNRASGKSGFTLVEIIAVLVILAILTAVAVPKYFDLTETAKTKAVQGAVAQGMSICSLAYAKKAIEAGGAPTVAAVQTEAAAASIAGDFTVTFTVAAQTIVVAATGKAGTSVAGATGQGIWSMP